MADARAERDWAHTSAVLAMLHNVNCGKSSDFKSPDHFNPLKARKRRHKRFDIEAFKMCVPAYREARVAEMVKAAAANSTPVTGAGLIGAGGGGGTPADPKNFIPPTNP